MANSKINTKAMSNASGPALTQIIADAKAMALSSVGDVFLLATEMPAPDHRCEIHSSDGRALWHAIDFADVPRLVNLFREEGKPLWLGQIFVTPWAPAPAPRERAVKDWKPLGAGDGLPSALGPSPVLHFSGCDLGLGNLTVSIGVACGAWDGRVTVEHALLLLDDFAKGSRERLAEVIGHHFGVVLEREVSAPSEGGS